MLEKKNLQIFTKKFTYCNKIGQFANLYFFDRISLIINQGVRMLKYFTGKNLIFLLLIIFLIYLMPKISGIMLLFFAAYVIACALNPYVAKLQKKFSRNTSAMLAVVIAAAAVFAVFLPIFLIVYKEIGALITVLPAKLLSFIEYLSNFSLFGHKLGEYLSINQFMDASPNVAQNIVNQSWNFTMGLFQVFVVFVALTMIIYYLLADNVYLKEKFIEFIPPVYREKASGIISSISGRVGGYVRAQILSMISVGVMMTIVLAILRIDYAFLLGLVTGVLDIIPLLGPTIALVAILLVAYQMGAVKIILIIAGFLLVQQLSNYIVRPILFGKFMQLHPLMIFLALFLAEQFLGFWGVILSPAIAATICVLVDELYLAQINDYTVEGSENA